MAAHQDLFQGIASAGGTNGDQVEAFGISHFLHRIHQQSLLHHVIYLQVSLPVLFRKMPGHGVQFLGGLSFLLAQYFRGRQGCFGRIEYRQVHHMQ
jgi:hypothetical protein